LSRDLIIEVEATSVERVPADLAIVLLFAGEEPLRGGAGRADWRLCGKLSQLVADGRLQGEAGEAALMATFGGLRVPLLLVLGVGPSDAFDATRYQQVIRDATARALALRVETLALPLAADALGDAVDEAKLRALLDGATAAMADAASPVELRLQLLAPREELARLADLLRRAQPGRIPADVGLRLPAAHSAKPARKPPPPAARGSELVK